MEEYEVEAHFSNALDQIARGSEPGVFIALLYAILTCSAEAGGQERLSFSAYKKRLEHSPGVFRRVDVYSILVHGISKENFEDHKSHLEKFRDVRIPPEKAEEAFQGLMKAIARVEGVSHSQGRVRLDKAIKAILADEPAPS